MEERKCRKWGSKRNYVINEYESVMCIVCCMLYVEAMFPLQYVVLNNPATKTIISAMT